VLGLGRDTEGVMSSWTVLMVDWATLEGVAYDWSIGYAPTVVANTLAGGSGAQHGVIAER
jgi:hypothetical protein